MLRKPPQATGGVCARAVLRKQQQQAQRLKSCFKARMREPWRLSLLKFSNSMLQQILIVRSFEYIWRVVHLAYTQSTCRWQQHSDRKATRKHNHNEFCHGIIMLNIIHYILLYRFFVCWCEVIYSLPILVQHKCWQSSNAKLIGNVLCITMESIVLEIISL